MNIFTLIFAITLLGSGSANVIPVQDPSSSAVKQPISLGNDTGLLSNPCPTPFIKGGYDEYCYYFSTLTDPALNWLQAQFKCRKMNENATLVRPYTKTIDLFIQGALLEITAREGGAYSYWWFDLSLIDSVYGESINSWDDLPFMYTDGTFANYTNWHYGEPSDQEFEHCGMYVADPYQWSTWYCGDTNKYICQVKQQDL